MARIFLLEDDDSIREAVAEYLRLADHEVIECERGDTAANLLRSSSPELLILDVAVPGMSGFSVAKQARQLGDVPIIFLTSRDDETSRITGLELGADDYVTKPFSPRELVLRVHAILRRAAVPASSSGGPAYFSLPIATEIGTMTFHAEQHVVTINAVPVTLTATEWRVLVLLVSRAPALVSRDVLIAEALGYDATVETRSADAHIKNLRARLGDPRWIETVRGFGYRFAGKAHQ
ncbi:MAG TPA: response regulator transcription factor [Alkalispirochaeta sp.]|nr:response regulator transcription factor [Alkalispirochaeta sp.]